MDVGKPVQDIRVIALGNPLRGDDGLGQAVLHRLQERLWPDCIRFIDGGTCGVDLLVLMEGATQVLIVDAVDMGRQPGDLVRFHPRDVRMPEGGSRGFSLHQAGLAEVLALGTELDILPPLTIYGIQPVQLAEGMGFSTPVEEAIGAAVSAVSTELTRLMTPGG